MPLGRETQEFGEEVGGRGKFPSLSIIVYYFIFKNHRHVLIEKLLFKVNLEGVLVPGWEEAPSGNKEIIYQHAHFSDVIKVLGPLGSFSMTSRVKLRQPSNLHYGLAVKAHSDHFPLRVPKSRCLQEPGGWPQAGWAGVVGEPKPQLTETECGCHIVGPLQFERRAVSLICMLRLSNPKCCQLIRNL